MDPEQKTPVKISRPRCPYCHDEIMPGGDNRACRECLSWHHEDCWDTHGSCVGCGNTWVYHGNGMSSAPAPVAYEIRSDTSPQVSRDQARQEAKERQQKASDLFFLICVVALVVGVAMTFLMIKALGA